MLYQSKTIRLFQLVALILNLAIVRSQKYEPTKYIFASEPSNNQVRTANGLEINYNKQQQQQPEVEASSASSPRDSLTSEQVEKLVSAFGDSYWHQSPAASEDVNSFDQQQQQPGDLFHVIYEPNQMMGPDSQAAANQQFVRNNLQLNPTTLALWLASLKASNGNKSMVKKRDVSYIIPADLFNSYEFVLGNSRSNQRGGLGSLNGNPQTRNYHNLVNDFKHYSRVANPSRESRAFKPKLMSTARGFGKRSAITYSDLLAASESTGNQAITSMNGKLNVRSFRLVFF